jgi:hypothetical protein
MLLLHEIVEFHLAGYSIMPIYEIRSVRSKKSERMVEKIFEAEGIAPRIGIADVPPLNDWPEKFAGSCCVQQNSTLPARVSIAR